MEKVVQGLLRGDTILFINNSKTSIIVETRKLENRSVEKPENEVTIAGSKDGFIEDIEINCSLIVRRLPTPDLRFAAFKVGRISQTNEYLIYRFRFYYIFNYFILGGLF